MKKFMALTTITAAAIIALSCNAMASSIYLKNSSVISGENIELGDIFGGLESNADKVLGPAPQPGSNLILNSSTLLRIAVAFDLPWRPTSSAEQVVLSGAATIIDEEYIKNLVVSRLSQEKTLDSNFEIEIVEGRKELTLPADMPATAEIAEISFDNQHDWFKATIASPSAANPVRKTEISGNVRRMVEVPILKNTIRNGDIISDSDLDFVSIYTKDLQHDFMLDAANIIGKTPRRMIVAGKPLRDIELQSPVLVKRGSTVTIMYENGSIRLTAEGKSLKDGADGDVVKVVNVNSNKAVDGVVAGDSLVLIR